MPKATRSGGAGKPRLSATKANAAGYAKRQARKGKSAALHGPTDDVYEYKQEKVRRANVTLDLDREEAAEFGADPDGDDREELRARLIGEHVENEMIDSGDDGEIDSDAAFEESDEERFAGFGFVKKNLAKQKSSKPSTKSARGSVRFADVDLNEDEDADVDVQNSEADDADELDDDEDMEEDGDPSEFIDVLDVLDGKGEPDDSDDAGGHTPATRALLPLREKDVTGVSQEEDEEADGDEDEEDDDESEEDDEIVLSASETEDVPEALDELQNFISALDPSRKRKADDIDPPPGATTTPRARKRRLLKERTEAGIENEFSAKASGAKLNLDDLLAPLASQSSNLLSLKKSTKALASASSKALAAPLPQRTQERLDREAAYEQTKEEVDKWKATMKRIKEAEHLSFPLQAQPAGRVSNLELAAKFKPTTELENAVDKLLRTANLREEDIAHTEALQMNHLSVEEVAARRAELRKTRELMFRAEAKAKRVAKIKSKTYRRIKKKERARLGAADEDDDPDDEAARLKREVERARERATLRHKNTGKWARAMAAKGELDVDERREINDMLERGERLRRRIKGVGSDDEGGDGSESESDDDEAGEDGIERIKKHAFDEVARIDEDLGPTGGESSTGKKKGVFEMKFMKDAMARGQRQADQLADDFIKEMGGRVGGDRSGSDTEMPPGDDAGPESGVAVERTGGRLVYRPGAVTGISSVAARPMGSLASDTSSVTLKSSDLISPITHTPHLPATSAEPPNPVAESSNPWLVPRDDAVSKVPRKNNEVVVDKNSAALDKSKNKLKKQARKREQEKEKEKDDAVVEISTDNVLSLNLGVAEATNAASTSQTKPRPKKKATAKAGSGVDHVQADDSDANSEVEEQEKALDRKGKGKATGPRAFEQRDLVALAFAGDNVVRDFEEAKRREIAADAPREVDTTLPGWGAWGGTGTKRQPTKPHLIKKIAGIDPTTRADFNKAHVIISEKRDKKAAKYLVKDLPYPYTSKAQYEKSIDQPLGTEWNTRVAFQRATLPKIVKKMGTIIDPLEKLF